MVPLDVMYPQTQKKEDWVRLAMLFWETAVGQGATPGSVSDVDTRDGVESFMAALAKRPTHTLSDEELYRAEFFSQFWQHHDGQITAIGLAQWADSGFPQVQMGHKFAAALLSTDVTKDALEHVRPPWRAFFIEIPDGLLSIFDNAIDKSVPIRRILVTQIHNVHGPWAYIAWTTSAVSMWRFGVTTDYLLPPAASSEDMPDHSTLEITDEDARVGALIGRLIINTCMAMSSPEMVRPEGKGHQQWDKVAKGNPLKMDGLVRQWQVGKPINIDLRERVREYIAGDRAKLSVRTLVRGHWKRQPHGTGRKEIKHIFVEPYWRGPEAAPVVTRPHVLGKE